MAMSDIIRLTLPNVDRSMCLAMHFMKERSTISQIECAKHTTGVRIFTSDKLMC